MALNFPVIPWGTLFAVLTIVTVGLVFWQLAMVQAVDKLRKHQTDDFPFRLRKASMLMKLVALCFTVAYGFEMGWDPWPPIVFFLVAADLNIISEILVLRKDEKRLSRLEAVTGGIPSRVRD